MNTLFYNLDNMDIMDIMDNMYSIYTICKLVKIKFKNIINITPELFFNIIKIVIYNILVCSGVS